MLERKRACARERWSEKINGIQQSEYRYKSIWIHRALWASICEMKIEPGIFVENLKRK